MSSSAPAPSSTAGPTASSTSSPAAGPVLSPRQLDTVNKLDPDKLFTGITVVGKGAHIPANVRVGRNVLINAARDDEDFAAFGDHVPSGETV